MFSWLLKKLDIKEKGLKLVQDARRVSNDTCEHLGALAGLFALESREYLGHQCKKAVLWAVTIFCFGLAYLLGWVVLGLFLCTFLTPIAVVGIAAGFHLLVGVILLLVLNLPKPKEFAPESKALIQADIQCVKLLVNDKKKNDC